MMLAKRLEEYWHGQGYSAARFWAEPIDERFEKVGTYEIYRVMSNLIDGLPPRYVENTPITSLPIEAKPARPSTFPCGDDGGDKPHTLPRRPEATPRNSGIGLSAIPKTFKEGDGHRRKSGPKCGRTLDENEC